jgi:hypothetical protein
MGPEGSLLFSQKPATGPYPEPDAFSPRVPAYPTSLRSIKGKGKVVPVLN